MVDWKLEIFGEFESVKKIWHSPWAGIPLWIVAAAFTVYWLSDPPPPGYAIGALAAVAGIMSVREIKTLGKISWVVLLICLLVTEFRAIDKDRTQNKKDQEAFFTEQKAGFGAITSQAKLDNEATVETLSAAVKGLGVDIEIANRTFLQTIPHAHLATDDFRLENPPTAGAMFSAGQKYLFEILYGNSGTKPAKVHLKLGKFYVGPADDRVFQVQLTKKFDEDWRKFVGKTTPSNATFPPQTKAISFWTEERTFDDEEIDNLLHKGATVYSISRIEYSDETGKWWSDKCEHYQVGSGTLNLSVTHSCQVLMNDRYPR